VARIGLTSANPTVQTVGGQEYIAYDLAIQVKIGP
jgi:hypothetical protein